MKRRWQKMWWVALVILIVAAGGAAFYSMRPHKPKAPQLVSCTQAAAEQFSCWQQRYRQLVAQKSPEAAFVDFKQADVAVPYVKTNCHQIAHVIGRAAALKYASLTETYAHGDNFCWSGYYHGATETVAKKIGPEKIVSQINTVCASFLKSHPYSFDHYNCVHGMGHGLMEVKDSNLFEALAACDSYDGDWQQESCYSGVFMENVMDEIIPGHHSDYLKNDEPLYPCTAVADRYKQQCYLMQTSHALLVVNYDYAQVFSLCAGVTAPYDTTCYQSLGRDVSGQASSDQTKTLQLCMLGATYAARDNCFIGAVKDFISYYHSDKQGLALCAAISDKQLSDSCTSIAHDYYRSF
jgi:hypothetical protein